VCDRRRTGLTRVLAGSGLGEGRGKAATTANTWVAQSRGSDDGRDSWDNWWLTSSGQARFLTSPQIKGTNVQVTSLYRTLSCQETAATPSMPASDLIVTCGLATFRFAPG
jgi:hypothetical protein